MKDEITECYFNRTLSKYTQHCIYNYLCFLFDAIYIFLSSRVVPNELWKNQSKHVGADKNKPGAILV